MSLQDPAKVILGIDPGSSVAGFGCLRFESRFSDIRKGVGILDAGVVRLNRGLHLHERICALFSAIEHLIAEHRPDMCVLEKAFVGANPQSALRLGEVRGAVIAACGQRKLALTELTPASVKKTVTGNGRASKDEVATCLEALLNFKRQQLPFDATDALALAFSYGLKLPWQSIAQPTNTLEKPSHRTESV